MTFDHYTTVSAIKQRARFFVGRDKLLKRFSDIDPNAPLSVLTILDELGPVASARMDDIEKIIASALPDDRLSRHYNAACLWRVLPIYEFNFRGDHRIHKYVEALRNDTTTDGERENAREAVQAALEEAEQALEKARKSGRDFELRKARDARDVADAALSSILPNLCALISKSSAHHWRDAYEKERAGQEKLLRGLIEGMAGI